MTVKHFVDPRNSSLQNIPKNINESDQRTPTSLNENSQNNSLIASREGEYILVPIDSAKHDWEREKFYFCLFCIIIIYILLEEYIRIFRKNTHF